MENIQEQSKDKKTFDGFIFDLDGTLLNTLPDLVVVTNKALADEGFPPHSEEAILHFVGDGVMSLVLQAVPDTATKEQAQRVYQGFRDSYAEYGMNLTKEYDGMTETLKKVRALGKKIGIMSNKFEGGVKDVEAKFFPGIIDAAHGESDTIPRKPNPQGLLLCAKEMGVSPDRCVYFGDSASDMLASHNAGMYAVGVTWGYQPLEKLKTGKPCEMISSPKELLNFC